MKRNPCAMAPFRLHARAQAFYGLEGVDHDVPKCVYRQGATFLAGQQPPSGGAWRQSGGRGWSPSIKGVEDSPSLWFARWSHLSSASSSAITALMLPGRTACGLFGGATVASILWSFSSNAADQTSPTRLVFWPERRQHQYRRPLRRRRRRILSSSRAERIHPFVFFAGDDAGVANSPGYDRLLGIPSAR